MDEGDTSPTWQKQEFSARPHGGTAWDFSTKLPGYQLYESHIVGPQHEGDLSQPRQGLQVLLDPLEMNGVDTSGAHYGFTDG